MSQTWENPSEKYDYGNQDIFGDLQKIKGDNDPLDIIELSDKIYKSGDID